MCPGCNCPACLVGLVDECPYCSSNHGYTVPQSSTNGNISISAEGLALSIVNNGSGPLLNGFEKLSIHAIKTASRPANIGLGQFFKNQSNEISSVSKQFKTYGYAVSGFFILMDVVWGVDENVRNNSSFSKTMYDVAVDITMSGGSFALVSIATTCGTMVCPGFGTAAGCIVGCVASLFIDVIIYPNGMTGRENLKSLYS